MKRGFRVFAFVIAAALALLAVPASASDNHESSYLALGDSVPFGYNPLVADPTDADNFVGYPELLSHRLDGHLANASCPGETTMHFISLAGLDDSCGLFRANFPLHVQYTGSQLDYAVAFLQQHPNTRLVTIMVGADDLNAFAVLCGGVPICIQQHIQTISLPNLATIFGTIRSVYQGPLVVVTYYARNNTPQEIQNVIQGNLLITGVAAQFQARIADGFAAFAAMEGPTQDPCAAGLLIKLPSGSCDDHPSRLGHRVLARAVQAQIPGREDNHQIGTVN